MKIRHLLVIFVSLSLMACATIKPNVVDPYGRMLPDPHYSIEPIGYPMRVTFYYAAFEEIPDLDGSIIKKPKFFSAFHLHQIDAKKYKAIVLVIEIANPTELEYKLVQHNELQVTRNEQTLDLQTGGILNASNLPYRQFAYSLPYGEDIVKVDQYVSLTIDNNEVLRIGSFRYALNY